MMDHSGSSTLLAIALFIAAPFVFYWIQVARRKRQQMAFRLRRMAVALALYLGVIGVSVKLGRTPLDSILIGFPAGVAGGFVFVRPPRRDRRIPPSVRRAVIERDLKGEPFNSRIHHLDHIVPFSKGGDHSPENLRVIAVPQPSESGPDATLQRTSLGPTCGYLCGGTGTGGQIRRPVTAYRVFVSYSTSNIEIAKWSMQALSKRGVAEVFVAEYSLEPGAVLDERILAEIRACDLFVLLWSGAARQSDWVPQEIGAARMADKVIVPIVLEPNLPVPGFLSNVKHLRAYENWDGAFVALQDFVDDQATLAAQRQQAAVVLGLILGGIALFSLGDDG